MARVHVRKLIPVVILSLVLGPYLLQNPEPDPLDDQARAGSAGRTATLTDGGTYYEIAGPAGGQPIVLVHGTTVPSFVWEPTFATLVSAGFRTVRYDLWGRGLSDRADVAYDLDSYVNQLEQLLDTIGLSVPVDLAGVSLGAMVVAEFALQHPERVRRLVLVDPAGVGTDLPLVARAATAPVLGEYLMRVAGSRQLRPSPRMLLHPERYPGFDSTYLNTIRFPGSRRAVLRTLRSVPFNGYDDRFRDLGELGRPIMIVWGREDTVVPFAVSERVTELVQPATFLAVDDAGHFPQWERPDVVGPALLEFLADADAGM